MRSLGVLLLLATACSNNGSYVTQAIPAGPRPCDVQVELVSNLTLGVCVDEVTVSWVNSDALISLVAPGELQSRFQCARVEQPGGSELGYPDGNDCPGRPRVDVPFKDGTASFVVSNDPGKGAAPPDAGPGVARGDVLQLNRIVANLAAPITVHVYDVRCEELDSAAPEPLLTLMLERQAPPHARLSPALRTEVAAVAQQDAGADAAAAPQDAGADAAAAPQDAGADAAPPPRDASADH